MSEDSFASEEGRLAGFDSGAAHSARVWNYLLGGKDNYPVDTAIGDQILQLFPAIARVARVQRRFHARAVYFLAGEAGVRQFLDIGTGLPAADNTHEVAQRVAPDCRVVYVDNDPLVLAYARALLTSTPEGTTAHIEADVRDPERILKAAADTLDFSRPVALIMLGIMGQISDEDDPWSIVRRLLAGLPAGSYLALSDGTNTNEALNAAIRVYNASAINAYHLRDPGRIADFFTGLEPVDPGVVMTSEWWRPGAADRESSAAEVDAVCGVGRKP